jgi:hypothetical protein
MIAIWMLVIAMVLLLGVAGVVTYRTQLRREQAEVSPLWLSQFSLARYWPMERLLSEVDLRFLETRPGFRPEMAREFRRQRHQAFRAYLEALETDFRRLHTAARQILAEWPEDNPQLASLLLSAQWRFEVVLLRLKWRLVLWQFGLEAPSMQPLFAVLDSLQTGAKLAIRPSAA